MKNFFTGCIAVASLAAMFVFLMIVVSVPKAQAAQNFSNLQQQQYRYDFEFKLPGFERRISNQEEYRLLLMELMNHLKQLRLQVRGAEDSVEVTSLSAENITNNGAKLRGKISDFNDDDYATVWFEYGTNKQSLNFKTGNKRIEEDEESTFAEEVSGLRANNRYYYRAVARGERGYQNYGEVLSFVTGDIDHPDVLTLGVDDVDNDSARLRGTVTMNGFENGEIFFVYGEDRELVSGVSDKYQKYAEINEVGDDLQKVLVDHDLDGSRRYSQKVANLDPDTKNYYAICAGYEDGNGEVVICGNITDFVTET